MIVHMVHDSTHGELSLSIMGWTIELEVFRDGYSLLGTQSFPHKIQFLGRPYLPDQYVLDRDRLVTIKLQRNYLCVVMNILRRLLEAIQKIVNLHNQLQTGNCGGGNRLCCLIAKSGIFILHANKSGLAGLWNSVLPLDLDNSVFKCLFLF